MEEAQALRDVAVSKGIVIDHNDHDRFRGVTRLYGLIEQDRGKRDKLRANIAKAGANVYEGHVYDKSVDQMLKFVSSKRKYFIPDDGKDYGLALERRPYDPDWDFTALELYEMCNDTKGEIVKIFNFINYREDEE